MQERRLQVAGAEAVGAAGTINIVDGRPVSLMGFTIAGGKIVAIDIIADPDRLRALDLDRL